MIYLLFFSVKSVKQYILICVHFAVTGWTSERNKTYTYCFPCKPKLADFIS